MIYGTPTTHGHPNDLEKVHSVECGNESEPTEMGDIQLDIAELRSLLATAVRPRIRKLLEDELVSLETKLSASKDVDMSSEKAPTEPQPIHRMVFSGMSETDFVGLQKYYWSDDGDFVSVTVDLPGIGQFEGVNSNLRVKFQADSVMMVVMAFNGKNFKFLLDNLSNPISADRSKYIVRKGSIRLKLWKETKSTWYNLVEKKKKPMPKLGKDEDPGVGIMKMMKNLYDEGDDEMKRTIAKAWEESQKKKGTDMM